MKNKAHKIWTIYTTKTDNKLSFKDFKANYEYLKENDELVKRLYKSLSANGSFPKRIGDNAYDRAELKHIVTGVVGQEKI